MQIRQIQQIPHYLIIAPINSLMMAWAQSHYPQYDRAFGAKSRRASYLIGRAMLAHALKTYYAIETLPPVATKTHGKPYLTPANAPHFNLSHSDTMIVLTLSHQRTIGVDIEMIRDRRNFPGLLTRTFTPHEIEWIRAQPNQKEAFFWLWSAKEAYLKADGRGLAGLDLLQFYPESNLMSGPLSHGTLLLTTYQSQSLALYSQYFKAEKLETLHLNDEGLYLPLSLEWSLLFDDAQ